ASGRAPHYVPLDASQALLEMACALARDSGFSCRGVKADLANAQHLAAVHDLNPAAPSLVMILGNTLGAFDPPDYCARLARLLRPQDHLLVDGEIFSAAATMSGYDNPLNRQFAFGPLRSLGLTEPEDGELQFESDIDDRKPGLYRVRKHFRAARDLALLIAGETIRLRAGERIEMNWSYKYAHDTFLELLHEAGMAAVAQYVSDDGRFLMALARKAGG
ncbi:MAG: L-histidine N(alpha)-methyltransferase, partial [bacterium]